MNDTTFTISQNRARRRQTMKAFVVSRYGKANSVEAVELPEPVLGDRDVLIQIHAASVNPLDLKIRMASSNPFCRTSCRSCWATISPASSLRLGEMCSGSNRVTRFMRSPTRIG